jgi:hypothetical protein
MLEMKEIPEIKSTETIPPHKEVKVEGLIRCVEMSVIFLLPENFFSSKRLRHLARNKI